MKYVFSVVVVARKRVSDSELAKLISIFLFRNFEGGEHRLFGEF
jgi:hypothetical protein